MLTFIIYLSGVILSFIMGRYTFKITCKREEFQYDWGFAMLNIIISLASWFGLIAIILVYLIENIEYKIKVKIPRWL